MTTEEGRLLEISQIPADLWDATQNAIRLPDVLSAAYKSLINQHGLIDLSSRQRGSEAPVGGLSKSETDRHFAQAFDGSAARAQLALLDPKREVTPTSEVFLLSLTGNSLTLTDVPCGAGAAAYALLTTIAQLRKASILPREPLDVKLIGGELSSYARTYASEMLELIRDELLDQAITVQEFFLEWDATDQISTADLIKETTHHRSDRNLLIVANFNGFLIEQRKYKHAKPQLDNLFLFSSGPNSSALWIEPAKNTAIKKGGILPNIAENINNTWKKFAKFFPGYKGEAPTTIARFIDPIFEEKTHRLTLAVLPLSLER
ncbi:hypothetical protein J7643_00010 [bacterium]|nr:hypothetical protein [bacterium]